MNRLTKQIQLVLISSSLAVGGCHHEPEGDVTCQRPPGQPPAEQLPAEQDVPPACGPVDGRHVGSPHGRTTFIPIPWSPGRTSYGSGATHGVSGVGGGKSGFSSGKSSVGGSSRGGFGSSGHAGS